MATRKPDLVRRSLFGSGDADEADGAPVPARKRSPRQSGGMKEASQPPAPEDVDRTRDGTREHRRQVERTAVTVPSDLLLRVKDAVAVLNGWPHQYTMARFVEEAFAAQLDRLKLEHNGGREFPITNRKIRTGRPPGT